MRPEFPQNYRIEQLNNELKLFGKNISIPRAKSDYLLEIQVKNKKKRLNSLDFRFKCNMRVRKVVRKESMI